ncbi:MAG: hypothetical protein IJF07_06480 [Lachnospiraceae bacterium]|nr:hypothetical protein [Lachnospiraceae bacterium]
MEGKKKVYLDATKIKECVSVYLSDAEVIWAGTTIYSMSVKCKNKEYERYAREYDIHFIFDDALPVIDFYAVPQFDILAVDSDGGLIGTMGKQSDLKSDAPICYLDKNKKCYLIADNGAAFLEKASTWKQTMTFYEGISIYNSQMDARKELEFIELCGFGK